MMSGPGAGGVRVSTGGVLVVPPFECAWLTGTEHELRDGRGCLSFEAKGETDVTVIFKAAPGAKRVQPLKRPRGAPGSVGDRGGLVEDNYTVILGSHRNRCLKFEKNGETVCMVENVARISGKEFHRWWVDCNLDTITVGCGAPGSEVAHAWTDPGQPIADLRNVGLSCWDRHVSYRDIRVEPPVNFAAVASKLRPRAPVHSPDHASPPPLFDLACSALQLSPSPDTICEVLDAAELLLPITTALYAFAVAYTARHLDAVFKQAPDQFCQLSARAVADVLSHNALSLPELRIFECVARWVMHGEHPDAVTVAAASAGRSGRCSLDSRRHSAEAAAAAALLSPASAGAAGEGAAEQQQQQQQQEEAVSLSSGAPLPSEGAHDPAPFNTWRPDEDVESVVSFIRFPQMSEHELNGIRGHPLSHRYACFGALVDEALESKRWSVDNVPDVRSPPDAFSAVKSASAAAAAAMAPLAASAAVSQQQQQQEGGRKGDADTEHSSSGQHAGASRDGRSSSIAGDGDVMSPLPGASGHSLTCSITVVAGPFSPALAGAAHANANGSTNGGVSCPGSPSGKQALAPPHAHSLYALENRRLLRAAASSAALRSAHMRFQRRSVPACQELMYVCDGDQNGALWCIATRGGSQTWVNPVSARLIDVRASSPVSRHTDPKAIVGGSCPRTNFAGPRHEPGGGDGGGGGIGSGPSTWWLIDLGPQHQLACNHYVMRADWSSEFVRSWALQGSNDLTSWVDLRRHVADTTLRLPGQYGSWPVVSPAATTPYRAFRLLLTGPTTNATQLRNFCLSYAEFYGHLFRAPDAAGVAPSGA